MKLIVIFCLLCTCASKTWCHNIFDSGDSLFQEHKYSLAALAFENAWYISSDNIIKQQALYKKAKSLEAIDDFESAYKTLNRASNDNFNDTLYYQVKYHAALYSYLTSRYITATQSLIQLEEGLENKNIFDSCWYLQTAIAIAQEEYIQAKSIVVMHFRRNNLQVNIDSLFGQPPKLKNMNLARKLSILPGLGQFYAGYFWEGIAGIGLVAVSLGWAVYLYSTGNIITPLISGAGLISRFYYGNINRAASLAQNAIQN